MKLKGKLQVSENKVVRKTFGLKKDVKQVANFDIKQQGTPGLYKLT
jgi:hypothetical protein